MTYEWHDLLGFSSNSPVSPEARVDVTMRGTGEVLCDLVAVGVAWRNVLRWRPAAAPQPTNVRDRGKLLAPTDLRVAPLPAPPANEVGWTDFTPGKGRPPQVDTHDLVDAQNRSGGICRSLPANHVNWGDTLRWRFVATKLQVASEHDTTWLELPFNGDNPNARVDVLWKEGSDPISRDLVAGLVVWDQALMWRPAVVQLVTEARKDDGDKVRFELLPGDALRAIAVILTFGAIKYSSRNWEKGMDWSRVFGALQRHLWSWWEGEAKDEETGHSHLWHAGACILFLIAYERRGTGRDDRPERKAA